MKETRSVLVNGVRKNIQVTLPKVGASKNGKPEIITDCPFEMEASAFTRVESINYLKNMEDAGIEIAIDPAVATDKEVRDEVVRVMKLEDEAEEVTTEPVEPTEPKAPAEMTKAELSEILTEAGVEHNKDKEKHAELLAKVMELDNKEDDSNSDL